MKAILMSIKPKWVAKILNGNKTIEIRKKFPRDYVGWVYIYCTKEDNLCVVKNIFKDVYVCGKDFDIDNFQVLSSGYDGKGKVVARFWVDKIDKYDYYQVDEELSALSCVPLDQLEIYVGSGIVSAIHISKLEIFDEPKELCCFSKPYIKDFEGDTLREHLLSRAPQSWCYISL